MTTYDPSPHDAVHSLIVEFADLARQVQSSDDFDASLRRLTSTAVQAVSGCEAASVSLITKDRPLTFAATDPIADLGDQIQYDEGEGPCLDAALLETWVSTPDLSVDPRWPRSAARMSRELGVGSMFSGRMTVDGERSKTIGGLNLYATSPHAFTAQDQMLAALLQMASEEYNQKVFYLDLLRVVGVLREQVLDVSTTQPASSEPARSADSNGGPASLEE